MRKILLFMLAVGGGCVVFAQPMQSMQPMPPQRDVNAELTSTQKRSELRTVLSAGRRPEPMVRFDPTEPTGHQLSQQERAEMREQLRRYQPPGASPAQRP